MSDYTRWQAARLTALQAEDGWLNLTDRVELRQGAQTVGAGAGNDIVLSIGPDRLGVLSVAGERAELQGPDGRSQAFANTASYPQLRVSGMLLELHSVDGAPALRVRDLARKRQVDLRCFPFDPAWVIQADWERLAVPASRSIGQKGAAETEVQVTHRAHFTTLGHDVTLLATHWKRDMPMFVIRDATSGQETYGASRFVIGEPDGSHITLDFNRAHNPPCAFTDFAICPLPPHENRLPFAIRAGEFAP